MERLQKIIAQSGFCSRRKAEEYISLGKVTVNGVVVNTLGSKANFDDIITVDGNQISRNEKKYIIMNKPRSIISSVNDEKGRSTVLSILPKEYQKYRLFPVGRLDYDTKGVLVLTNDGEFMNTLVGPQSNLEKEYLARLQGIITVDSLRKLERGLPIDDYVTRPCIAYLKSVDEEHKSSLVGIILKEGKYHQVKKMFEAIDYPVKRLTRVRFGELNVNGLKEGEFRELTPHEIKRLVVLSNSSNSK